MPADTGRTGARGIALAMFGLLLVAYTLMSADRYLISILAPDIRNALSLSLPQMGALTTLFTLGIALAGLPAGSLIARYSRKTVLLAGIVLFSGATYLFTVATGFFSMLALIVLQGAGMAFLVTSMFSLSASYFSANRVAAVGIVNMCFGLGSFLGPWAIGDLRSTSGNYQTPMVVFGACGIALAVIIALVVRPWFTETRQAASQVAGTGGAGSLNNRNTIVLTVLSIIYGLAVYGFLGLYPTFLRESLQFTPAEAGEMLRWFGFGSLLAYFGGMLGDRLPTKIVIIGSSLIIVVLGFFLYLPDLGRGARQVFVLLYGIFGAAILYTNLAGAHIKSLNRSLASRGSSMFVTTLYFGGAFGGYLMGELVRQLGWVQAGQLQISVLTLMGAVLALWLQPAEMSK
jgi:MFS transporter, DHA1 family, inner membrane transport protein